MLKKYDRIWDKFSNSMKKGFDSKLTYIKNIEKLKQNLMKETSAQIFMVIRYQRKVLNAFGYRYY